MELSACMEPGVVHEPLCYVIKMDIDASFCMVSYRIMIAPQSLMFQIVTFGSAVSEIIWYFPHLMAKVQSLVHTAQTSWALSLHFT
jgi:hypothetical protein